MGNKGVFASGCVVGAVLGVVGTITLSVALPLGIVAVGSQVAARVTDTSTVIGTYACHGCLYGQLVFRPGGRVNVAGFYETSFTQEGDRIYVEADPSDLTLRVVDADTLQGEGFAEGTYKRQSEEALASTAPAPAAPTATPQERLAAFERVTLDPAGLIIASVALDPKDEHRVIVQVKSMFMIHGERTRFDDISAMAANWVAIDSPDDPTRASLLVRDGRHEVGSAKGLETRLSP